MGDVVLDRYTAGQGRIVPVDHTGPVSYTTGGETIGAVNSITGMAAVGLGSLDDVLGSGSYSVDGSYVVYVQPTGTGSRKTFTLIWAGGLFGTGVLVTQNAAGATMTPGTVVPIVFAGGTGSGAAGTVTVLTATTISIQITNAGKYTAAPTATVTGTGGTPPTLTVALLAAGAQPAAGTNLSGETVRLVYVGK